MRLPRDRGAPPGERSLDVDDPARLVIEFDFSPLELGQEHGKVESADVEAGQVTRVQQLHQGLGSSGQRRLVGQVFVRDPVDSRGLGVNGYAGVEAANPLQHVALRGDAEYGHLDDPIIPGAKSRRLQIQEDDGTVELNGEEHQAAWRSVCISL